MGLIRLFCIFFGLVICIELPTDDGVSMFRSFFAFFIMIALDYSRMWLKGKSTYEKSLGLSGLVFSLLVLSLNILGLFKQLILEKFTGGFNIVSSETFRLFPHIHINSDGYFQWVSILTMSFAVCELIVPYSNRYSDKVSDVKEKEKKKSWFRIFSRKEKLLDPQVDNTTISKSLSEGGK